MYPKKEEKLNTIPAKNRQDALWSWSASDMAYGIRTGLFSSRETVKSCLERINQVNPKINAIVEVLADEALREADAADHAVLRGEKIGPLHGVPIVSKINTDHAGHATTDGVVAYKGHIASQDSPPIANLRKAGGIFVGRTNVPSFSLRWFSNNDLHGCTLNPWDSTRTPGGSSGGSSSAVASGMVPIAHGNDIAGSIRYPAYACGVTGIRPTVGRVPGSGPINVDSSLAVQMMGVQGPLARKVKDLRIALEAMSAPDTRDPIYAQVPLIGEPLKGPVRVGLLRDVGVAKPDPLVNQELDAAASYLKDAGYIVEEVELPLFYEAYKLWFLILLEDLRGILPMIGEFGDKAANVNLEYVYKVSEELWGKPSLEKYKQGYARRGTLIAQLQQFLEEYPLILFPSSTEQAFLQDEDIESVSASKRLLNAQWPMVSVPVLGFPAISVPTSVTSGLPNGVQLLGRRFREDTLFDAAEIIEARSNMATPIDPKF
ncbi:amidase family protein [Metabacillus litoralis]|uniref:amidase family protein n=1 Tax=Metabacillus litoralis TaxID=152268 RepID=UPI000EF58F5C|nr:amidase family protein [Metabacillus litoralis]MCM3163650.1 amidase family protein [Metabacillus litoralis]UHA60732.1 amidase family protein [Metabacillus litoralis]